MTWRGGAGGEAPGLTPTTLSRVQRRSISLPGAGGKGGGGQATGGGVFCAPQLELVTSSYASQRDILPNAGLEHTLHANTTSREKRTMAEGCEALIFILLVLCVLHTCGII